MASPSSIPASTSPTTPTQSAHTSAPPLSRRQSLFAGRAKQPPFQQLLEEDEEDDDLLLSSLDGDDFDAVSWLNAQLDSTSPSSSAATDSLQTLDGSLSALLTQVSVSRQDVGASIERGIASARGGIPKLVGEMAWIGNKVEQVHTSLSALAERSGSIAADPDHALGSANGHTSSNPNTPGSSEGAEALAKLSELHSLHTHLTSYQSLLRLASSWSTLSSDVSLLLSEATSSDASTADSLASFSSASVRLKEAADSLEVFGDSSEGKEKKKLLTGLIDSLEAAISSHLVAKVRGLLTDESAAQAGASPSPANVEDFEVIQTYAAVLSRVGRAASFSEYWRGTRRGPMLESWEKAKILEEAAAPTPAPTSSIPASLPRFSAYLPAFLSSILGLMSSERLYAPILYPEDPLGALDSFLASTLESLRPTLSQRFKAAIAYHGDQGLPEALLVLRVLREKGREMERLMSRLAASTKVTKASSAQGPPPRRRDSQSSLPPRPEMSPSASRTELKVADTPSTVVVDLPGKHAGATPLSEEQTSSRFLRTYYAALSPLWDQFGDLDLAVLRWAWRRESQALSLYIPANTANTGGLGDESLPLHMEKLQRSWVAISDLCEDALSRCLEVTAGLGASTALHTADMTSAEVVEPIARDVEEACRMVWGGLVSEHSRAPAGREWTAYGRSINFLGALKDVFDRTHALQGTFAEKLKDTAEVFSAAKGDAQQVQLAASLAELCKSSGAAAPSKEEMRVLLESSMAQQELGQTLWKKIVAVAQSAAAGKTGVHMLSNGNGSGSGNGNRFATMGSPTPHLALLPRLQQTLHSLLQPLIHSMVVLPLVPILTNLSKYHGLAHWTSPTLPGQVANDFDLSMPSFSLGPTEIMQTVGEAVLGLVRELETWLGEEGWKWSVELLLAQSQGASSSGGVEPGDTDEAAGAGAAEEQDGQALRRRNSRRSSMLPSASGAASTPAKLHRRRSSFMPAAPSVGGSGGGSGSGGGGSGSEPSHDLPLMSPQEAIGGTNRSGAEEAVNALLEARHKPLTSSPMEETEQPMGGDDAREATSSPTIQRTQSHDQQQQQQQQQTTTTTTTRRASQSTAAAAAAAAAPANVLPLYISALLSFLSEHLLQRVLPLLPERRRMSEAGWKQLTTDLDWFQRVVKILDQEQVDGTEGEGEGEGEGGWFKLRGWEERVGAGSSEAVAAGGIDATLGYRSPWVTSAAPGTRGAPAHAPAHDALKTSSVRQMLLSQRDRTRTPTPTPASSSSSAPRGGAGAAEGREGRTEGKVDLSAVSINVGMGW